MKSDFVVIGLVAIAVLWAGNEWTKTLPQPAVSDVKPAEVQVKTPIVAEVVAVEVKQIEPTILMHSSSDCVHCDRWWAQRGDWEKLGWKVEKTIDIAPVEGHRVWPWFRVRDRDVEFTVDGYMDGDRFKAARRKALVR